MALLLGLKKRKEKKTCQSSKKPSASTLYRWGYICFCIPSLNTPLYRETRLDSFIVLQIFKFSESFISISISLFLPWRKKPHSWYPPLFTFFLQFGVWYTPANLLLFRHTNTPFSCDIKKIYTKILLLLQQLLLPPYKKDSYFSSCYVERKMLLSSVAISSPIPYTIKKITKNAKKTL